MKKRQIYNKINQIDSINQKIDNILETQFVENSGQYINMEDTSDGFSKAVMIEGNTHQNIYNGGEIKVQPNIEATDSEIYIPRSLEGELDKFSIDGKSMKNLTTCEREMVVQEGQEVEGRSLTLNTVAGGRVEDITIKGVSIQNFTTEDMMSAVTQPVVKTSGNKVSIPDSYEGNLDFSEIKINGKTYNNLLRHEFMNSSVVTYDTSRGVYTITCTAGNYECFLWNNVFLKDNTEYTVAFNVVSTEGSSSNYQPISGDREFGSIIHYGTGIGYKKVTFRTNKSASPDWNHKKFTIWFDRDVAGKVAIANPILLEGDFSNVELPNKINGMDSVNQGGSGIDITSYSQNLVDISTIIPSKFYNKENHTVTVSQDTETSYKYGECDISYLKPNTNYTISANMVGNGAAIRIYDWNTRVAITELLPSQDSKTFTTPNNVSKLSYLLYCSYGANFPAGTSATFSNIQLVEGDVKKPYMAFNKTVTHVNTELALRSIGDVKDTIEKIDGDWYHVKRIGEYNLRRDAIYTYSTPEYNNAETLFIPISGYAITNKKRGGAALSKLLPFIERLPSNTVTESGCSMGSNLDIRLRLDLLGDVTNLTFEKKVDKAIEYLVDKGMTILYELEVPVLTKITKPSIKTFNNSTYITSSDVIKPELNIDTKIGVNTIADKIKNYSVVFDAEKLTDGASEIKIEVDNHKYATQYTFTDKDISRHVIKIVSENPNPRINFITPGFKISDVMVLEGYEDDYYNFDFISGLKSVDKNLNITVSGANVLDYTRDDYVNKSTVFTKDDKGYISGNLLASGAWKIFLSNKKATNNRCKPDTKYTAIFDVAQSSLVPQEGFALFKFGNGENRKGAKCCIHDMYRYNELNEGILKQLVSTTKKEHLKSATYASRVEFAPGTSGDVKFRYMLVEGDMTGRNLPYQAFKEIKKTITLKDEMRSLPNGVRDTIEKIGDKWYFVQRVGKRVLNNSTGENWEVHVINNSQAVRVKSTERLLGNSYKFRTSGEFNYRAKGYCQSYDPSDKPYRLLLNHVAEGTVQFIMPRYNGEPASAVLDRFKKNIVENPVELFYELTKYVFTEIPVVEIETMDTHTHIYSYTPISPIIKASTVSRAKMQSMVPNNKYTLMFTANKHTSTSNILNVECDGVPYSFTLGEGDNFIKQTFTTNKPVNTQDIVFKTVGMKIKDVIIVEGDYNKLTKPNYFRGIVSSAPNKKMDIVTTGANIFKAKAYNRGNASHQIIDDNNIKVYNTTPGTYCFKYFIMENVKPNTKYRLDIDTRIVTGIARIIIREAGFTDGNIYHDLHGTGIINNSEHVTLEFVTSSRINKDRVLTIALYSNHSETKNAGEVYFENISLRQSESNHYTYEKYKEIITSITLTQPLHSLPDGTKDTIEQKEDGSWVVKRRIKRVKLSEIGLWLTDNYNDKFYRYVPKKNGVSGLGTKIKTNKKSHIMADMFEGVKADDTWILAYKGIALNANGDIDMVIEKSIIDSIGIDNWLAMNDGYIYFESNSVVEETLPQLNKLKLFNYGTHITTPEKLANINIQNECKINIPLLQSGKEYTIIMDINSSYASSNEPLRVYSGSAFAEINRVHTHKFDEYLKYYTNITTTVEGFIKLDNAGSKIRNLQIIQGNKSTEHLNGFIPFGVNSVGDDGMFKIKSRGKNILDIKSFYDIGKVKMDVINETEFILTNLSSANWVAAWFRAVEFEKGTPYTISYDYEVISGAAETTISVRQGKTGSSFSLLLNTVSGSTGRVVSTFVPRLQHHQIEIFVSRTSSNLNGKIKIKNFQIEKGSVRTLYEPYKENIVSIPLTNGPLRKLPNGVKDTIEFIAGVPTIVRRVGVTTVDGSSDESWRLNDTNEVRTQFTCVFDKLSISTRQNDNIYCDKVIARSFNNIPEACWIYDGNYIVIQKDKHTFPTKEKLLSWLAVNPVTVTYELPEYTYEAIPDVLLSLQTFNKFTHISGQDTIVYPNLTFKFAANLGAIIQSNNERISVMIGKLEKLEQISFTNIMNVINLQEQLDNHIKKL